MDKTLKTIKMKKTITPPRASLPARVKVQARLMRSKKICLSLSLEDKP
jgi:hypothetical protein